MSPEQEAVLRAIRKLVDFWQITPEELSVRASKKVHVAAPLPEVQAPKYRHPRTGETWDGVGSQPQWVREALTKQGYTVEELKSDSPLNQQSIQGL
jgi:DNA-binding protein H-NS